MARISRAARAVRGSDGDSAAAGHRAFGKLIFSARARGRQPPLPPRIERESSINLRGP